MKGLSRGKAMTGFTEKVVVGSSDKVEAGVPSRGERSPESTEEGAGSPDRAVVGVAGRERGSESAEEGAESPPSLCADRWEGRSAARIREEAGGRARARGRAFGGMVARLNAIWRPSGVNCCRMGSSF